MTKEDCVWVAIRLFGIYLLVLAIIAVPGIIHSAHMAHQTSRISEDMRHSELLAAQRQSDLLRTVQNILVESPRRYLAKCIEQSLRFVVFMVVGLYLARKGQFVFNLVSKPLRSQGGA